jgi:hypothetical protein
VAQVRDLDRIVATLRKNRRDCGKQTDQDREHLTSLTKQEGIIREKLQKLETRLTENEDVADRIREQIKLATGQLSGVRLHHPVHTPSALSLPATLVCPVCLHHSLLAQHRSG